MTDLKNISTIELEKQLEEIKQICLHNCELSSHILEVKIQEMYAIHYELESRKAEIKKEVIEIIGRLRSQILSDAYRLSPSLRVTYKLAIDFLLAMETPAIEKNAYAKLLILWARVGGADALKKNLLLPLGYKSDLMEHFEALVIIDDCREEIKNQSHYFC
jgi:hypothetical protein